MIAIGIDDNVSKALRKFESVIGGAALVPIMLKAGQAAGVAAESVVSPYPTATGKPLAVWYTRQRKDGTTYKSKFKSAKQQGYVMALAARGLIPYKRTGTLGRSITSEARNASVIGVDIVIGSNRKYAPLVIGKPPQQSHYHQGNWTPLADNVERNVQTIADAFGRAALKGINDYLNSNT
jgi:hypothetical protein